MVRPENHVHKFVPEKRIARVVISKCQCGQSKKNLVIGFDDEKASLIDSQISRVGMST